MNTPTRSTLRRFLGNRTAVVAAGTAGFLLGAGGLVAAQNGADDAAPATEVTAATTETTVADTTVDTTVDTVATPATSVDVSIPTTVDDSPVSSLPGGDDHTSTTIDDNTSTSLPDSDDDNTSTSLPDSDDDSTSTSVAVSLPGPFTETYQSSGGSISVSWSGTALSITSISPAAGFVAEIEENSWDKVRVDFEHENDDYRIEVGLHDGRIRVRID